MCWDITLHARILIGQPGATHITSCLEDCVTDNIAKLRIAMLELVRQHQAGKPRANGEYLNLPRFVGELRAQHEWILSFVFDSDRGVGGDARTT